MYEKYLKMSSVPAGKILEIILKKKNLSQTELAAISNEYPQRISEYIQGKRKFTIKASLAIEKALHINIEGFFVKLQLNHEIYSCISEAESKNHPNLDKYSQALFWDTQISKINWIRNKIWVIKRVFEYGDEEEINETIKFYGKSTVDHIIRKIDDTWNKTNRIANYNKYIL
jgi:antitoxin HigA-1